jgi:hypothetical protein
MVAAVMGNDSAMGSRTAKQLWWAMGQRQCNGWHNGRQMIAANAEAVQWEVMWDGRQRQSWWMVVARSWWTAAVAMGNHGAMGSKTAKQSQWAMGQWRHNGQRNWRGMIATDAEVVQWEATRDEWQRQSQWTAAVRLQWTAAAALGNGGAMGSGTEEWLRWAMGRRRQCDGQHNGQWMITIAANAEAAQWEAMQDGQQRQSQWTAKVWLGWTAAAAMGNGNAMGIRTAKQSWRAMGRRWHDGQHNMQWAIASG